MRNLHLPPSALTDPFYSVFYLVIITMSLVMKAYFRSIAAVFTNPAPAQAVAGISLLILTLYTGYNIPITRMIGALRWLIYINVSFIFSLRNMIYKLYTAGQIRVRIDPDERISYLARKLFVPCSLRCWI